MSLLVTTIFNTMILVVCEQINSTYQIRLQILYQDIKSATRKTTTANNTNQMQTLKRVTHLRQIKITMI